MAQDIILTVGGDTRPLENVINRAVNQKRKIGSLDVRGFEQPLGRITGKASEFQKSLEASNARVIAFGASAGMIYSVQTAMSKLVESTIEVEKSLTDINVLLGMSQSQLSNFSSELFDAASKNATSFANAAEAAGEFARQGLSAAETIQRTSDALTLSRLSGLDFTASVQAMTAALNSFSKEALTTTEIVDRMAAVDAAFAVSSADLAEAIRRVASSADSANVSLNETIAVVTAAQQITARGGAKIGNAFKTIFTRLQRPKVLDQLEAIGVATKNAAGMTLPLMQVLQNLANKYDLLTQAQKSYISEQIGSVYQINILKAVMKDLGGDLSLYSRALKTAEDSMGSSEKRTEQLNQTLSAKLTRSLNAAKEAAASLGKITIAPTIGGVADIGTTLFGGIAESAEKGEGAMGRVGQGMLKGIGAVIQGPGLQALVSLGIKLFGNLTKFISESSSQMGAFGDEAQNVESIQESILAHLKENPEVLRDITNGTLSVEDAHARVMNKIKDETALLRQQLAISKELAESLHSAGVKVTSTTVEGQPEQGLPERIKNNPMMLSKGYIPSMAAAEREGARLGGYTAGAVVKGPDLASSGGPKNTIINTAEKVSTVGGKTWVSPPESSRAGAAHKKESVAKTGINPYQLSKGFVPNFADFIVTLNEKGGPEYPYLNVANRLEAIRRSTNDHYPPHVPYGTRDMDRWIVKHEDGEEVVYDKMTKLQAMQAAGNRMANVPGSNRSGIYSTTPWDGREFSGGFIPNFEEAGFERKFKSYFQDPEKLAEQFFVGHAGTLSKKAKEAGHTRTKIEDLGDGQKKVHVLGLRTTGPDKNAGETLGSFVFSSSFDDDVRHYDVGEIQGDKMTEELAVQYVKELAGFNSNRGEYIAITSPNSSSINQFLGIGRESIAFAGPEVDGKETAMKEALHRTYPNIKQDTGELQGQSGASAANKFETRHEFLTALQDENYNILGENVRFPERLGGGEGRFVEENVYAGGGQDFLEMYNEAVANGKGKETLGAIQFYLQQIQEQGRKTLGVTGHGAAAFPNLDPRTATVAAHPEPEKGMIKKMTDNVLISSLEDVENLQKIISDPTTSASLIEYSDGFEAIRKASMAYKADSNDANLDALMKLEESQKIATANIATQFPELNNINRIVLDFETALTDSFTHAPEYTGTTGLTDKLNQILDGKQSVAVSKGFIPSYATEDNSEIVDKLAALVEGGNIATAQQLLNTLGKGNESLGDDLVTSLYARLKNITTSIAEIRGVSELEQVRGEPSIPTMIGVNTNMKGSREGLAFLNKSTDNEVAKSKKELQKNKNRKTELEKEMREHEAYRGLYGEAGIPEPEGSEWAEKVAETSRELSDVDKAIEFSGVANRGPHYEKNVKQIDLLDRGIRIKEALGIQTGKEYLGSDEGHGVTGTGTLSTNFLSKPGETFPGTDLPVPLNPNLVDPDIHNLPPIPQMGLPAQTDVTYHHKDPHDYPWLGKGVSGGFIPNFVDPAMLAEIGQLITSGAIAGTTAYGAARSMFGEIGFDPLGVDDKVKDPKWLENLVLGAGDVAFTDLDDLGSIPNKLRGMLGRDPKASGHVPNFLDTKPKRPGERGGKPWLLQEAVKFGIEGLSTARQKTKDLFDPSKPSKLAEKYISGTLSSGYIPNFDDLEVVGNIADEKAAYVKFFKDYREGNVQNDAGIDLEVLERELAAFGPYLFATDQEGRMDPQIEAFLEANRQRLRQLGYLSGGFVPSFAASEYILQGSDGSEIERVRKTRENLEYLQQSQEKHAGSRIFSTADDGLTDEPILSKGFVPNFFFKSWAERKEERAGGRRVPPDSMFFDILGMESTLDDERTGVKFKHSLLGRLANVPLAAAKLGIGGIQKMVGMLPAKGGGSLSDNWDEQEDLSSLGVGVIDSLLDIGRFPFEMEGDVPAVQQFVGGSTEHPGTTRVRDHHRKRRERRESDKRSGGFVPNFEKGFFDSDMIGNRTESTQIVDSIVGGNEPYEVYHGPAGGGKTTLALKDHSDATIIQSLKHYQDKKDNEDWSKFVVLSGTGRGRTSGQYSERAAAILRGATGVTAVIPDDDTLKDRRLQRIKDEESRLTAIAEGENVDRDKLDKRDLNALKGTLKAPMSDYQLYDELEAEGQNVTRITAEGFVPNFAYPPYRGHAGDLAGDNEFAAFFNEQAVNQQWGRSEETFTQSAFDFLAKMGWGNYANASWASMIEPSDFEVDGESPSSFAHLNNFENNLGHNVGVHKYLSLMGVRASVPSYHLFADDGSWEKWGPLAQRRDGTDPYGNFGHPMKELDRSLFSRGGVQTIVNQFRNAKGLNVAQGFVPNFRKIGFKPAISNIQTMQTQGGLAEIISGRLLSGSFDLSDLEGQPDFESVMEDKSIKRIYEGYLKLQELVNSGTTRGMDNIGVLDLILTREKDEELDRLIYSDPLTPLAQQIVDLKAKTTEGIATKAEKDQWIEELGRLDVLSMQNIDTPTETGKSMMEYGIRSEVLPNAPMVFRTAIMDNVAAAIRVSSSEVIDQMNVSDEDRELLKQKAFSDVGPLPALMEGPIVGDFVEMMIKHLFTDRIGEETGTPEMGDTPVDIEPGKHEISEIGKRMLTEGIPTTGIEVKGIKGSDTADFGDAAARKKLEKMRETYNRGFIPSFNLFTKEITEAEKLGGRGAKAHMGEGTIGGKPFVMNDQEIEIPNFGRNGDSAVIPTYGQVGRDKSKQLRQMFFSGHIPNFATGELTETEGLRDLLAEQRKIEDQKLIAAKNGDQAEVERLTEEKKRINKQLSLLAVTNPAALNLIDTKPTEEIQPPTIPMTGQAGAAGAAATGIEAFLEQQKISNQLILPKDEKGNVLPETEDQKLQREHHTESMTRLKEKIDERGYFDPEWETYEHKRIMDAAGVKEADADAKEAITKVEAQERKREEKEKLEKLIADTAEMGKERERLGTAPWDPTRETGAQPVTLPLTPVTEPTPDTAIEAAIEEALTPKAVPSSERLVEIWTGKPGKIPKEKFGVTDQLSWLDKEDGDRWWTHLLDARGDELKVWPDAYFDDPAGSKRLDGVITGGASKLPKQLPDIARMDAIIKYAKKDKEEEEIKEEINEWAKVSPGDAEWVKAIERLIPGKSFEKEPFITLDDLKEQKFIDAAADAGFGTDGQKYARSLVEKYRQLREQVHVPTVLDEAKDDDAVIPVPIKPEPEVAPVPGIAPVTDGPLPPTAADEPTPTVLPDPIKVEGGAAPETSKSIDELLATHPKLQEKSGILSAIRNATGELTLRAPVHEYIRSAADGSPIKQIYDLPLNFQFPQLVNEFNRGRNLHKFAELKSRGAIEDYGKRLGKDLHWQDYFYSEGANSGNYINANEFQSTGDYGDYLALIEGTLLPETEIEEVKDDISALEAYPGGMQEGTHELGFQKNEEGSWTGLGKFSELQYEITARLRAKSIEDIKESERLSSEISKLEGGYEPILDKRVKESLMNKYNSLDNIVWGQHDAKKGLFEARLPWALNAKHITKKIEDVATADEDFTEFLINQMIEDEILKSTRKHKARYKEESKVAIDNDANDYVGEVLMWSAGNAIQEKIDAHEEHEALKAHLAAEGDFKEEVLASGFVPNYIKTEGKQPASINFDPDFESRTTSGIVDLPSTNDEGEQLGMISYQEGDEHFAIRDNSVREGEQGRRVGLTQFDEVRKRAFEQNKKLYSDSLINQQKANSIGDFGGASNFQNIAGPLAFPMLKHRLQDGIETSGSWRAEDHGWDSFKSLVDFKSLINKESSDYIKENLLHNEMEFGKLNTVPVDGVGDGAALFSKGFVPSFFDTTVSSTPMERDVWDSATGKVEKEEYERKYIESEAGYMEYEEEDKALSITGHNSKKKGGGFAHMKRLGREARGVGKTIKSGTLVNQLINEKGSRDNLTNVDPFEAIAKHAYPQLRQRNQPGWKNTGRFGADIGGNKVDFSFKSLKNLKSQLSKFSREEIADAIIANKISISNLESDPGKGGMMDEAAHKIWGLKFSKGFVPNFVETKGSQPLSIIAQNIKKLQEGPEGPVADPELNNELLRLQDLIKLNKEFKRPHGQNLASGLIPNFENIKYPYSAAEEALLKNKNWDNMKEFVRSLGMKGGDADSWSTTLNKMRNGEQNVKTDKVKKPKRFVENLNEKVGKKRGGAAISPEERFSTENIQFINDEPAKKSEGWMTRVMKKVGLKTDEEEPTDSQKKNFRARAHEAGWAEGASYFAFKEGDKHTAGRETEGDLETYLGMQGLFNEGRGPNIDIPRYSGAAKEKMEAIGLDVGKHTNYEVKSNAGAALRSKGIKQMLASHGELIGLIHSFDNDDEEEIVAAGNISDGHKGAIAVPKKGGGGQNMRTTFQLSTLGIWKDYDAEVQKKFKDDPDRSKDKHISSGINIDYYDPSLIKAKGFIPNFSGIKAAIKREESAQSSKAIAEYSNTLGGIGVYNQNQKSKYGSLDKTIQRDHIDRGQSRSSLHLSGSGRETYRASGYVPNFQGGIGAGAELSMMLGAFQNLREGAGDLGDGFNKLFGTNLKLFRSNESLAQASAEANQALAEFEAATAQAKDKAGFSTEEKEQKKEEVVQKFMEDPSAAYDQMAVTDVAKAQIAADPEKAAIFDPTTGGSSKEQAAALAKEEARVADIIAKPADERSEAEKQVVEDVEMKGDEFRDKLGSETATTPKEVAAEAEAATKTKEADEKKLSELESFLSGMDGTPAAKETGSPKADTGKAAAKGEVDAKKADIDNATIHIDSAVINVKSKAEGKKKEEGTPAPAAGGGGADRGLMGAYEEKAKKSLMQKQGARIGAEQSKLQKMKKEGSGKTPEEIAKQQSKVDSLKASAKSRKDNLGENEIKQEIKILAAKDVQDQKDKVADSSNKETKAKEADVKVKEKLNQAAEREVQKEEDKFMDQDITDAELGIDELAEAAAEAAQKLRDAELGGHTDLAKKRQGELDQAQEKLGKAKGMRGKTRGEVQQALRGEAAAAEAEVETKKREEKRSKFMGGAAATIAGVGTTGVESIMGPEASDAKTAMLGVTKGATEAAQTMAAIPGPAGMVIGGMLGASTALEGVIEYSSGIATLRKEFEIQKQHHQEVSSALTSYSQALGELTNSYGDPTVTQKTIDRLNKKMMDSLANLPDSKEATQIKASIMGASTPEQKQNAIAEAQALMTRTQGEREQTMAFQEQTMTHSKTQGMGGLGFVMGLLGKGGGWSEGGSSMFDKRNILGWQSERQATESKEELRQATTGFVGNLSAPQMKKMDAVMSTANLDTSGGQTAAIESMVEMGVMTRAMADEILESAEATKKFTKALQNANKNRKIAEKTARDMAAIRSKDLARFNSLKIAAQSVQNQIKNLTDNLNNLNRIRIQKQVFQGQRSVDAAAGFGRRGGQAGGAGLSAVGILGGRGGGPGIQTQAMQGAPNMMGRVGRAGMMAEAGPQSAAALFMGDEAAAQVTNAIEINEILEGAQTASEAASQEGRAGIAEAAIGAIGLTPSTTLTTGPGGATTVANEDVVRAQNAGAATITAALKEAQEKGLSMEDTASAMTAGLQGAAIDERLEAIKNDPTIADPDEKKKLEEMKTATEKGEKVDQTKLNTLLADTGGLTKGEDAMALSMAQGANLEGAMMAEAQKQTEALSQLNSKALEDLQVAKKNQVEQAKLREAMRSINSAGGIAAFTDRKQERKIDRDMRRSAMRVATSRDPVRRGRAAAALGKQVQDMVGGSMGAAGEGIQQIAIEGNTKRIEDQFGRQIKNMDRAMRRAPAGSKQQQSLAKLKGELMKGRNNAAKIAADQVKHQMKLQKQPENIEKMVQQLENINSALAMQRDVDIKINEEAMSKPMVTAIEAQTQAFLDGIKALDNSMKQLNEESAQATTMQEKQSAALEMINMAEANNALTPAKAAEMREKIQNAKSPAEVAAIASDASASLAADVRNRPTEYTEEEKIKIQGLQDVAGVGKKENRDDVTKARTEVDKAKAELRELEKDPAKNKKAIADKQKEVELKEQALQTAEMKRAKATGKEGSEHYLGPEVKEDRKNNLGMSILKGAGAVAAIGGAGWLGKKAIGAMTGGKGLRIGARLGALGRGIGGKLGLRGAGAGAGAAGKIGAKAMGRGGKAGLIIGGLALAAGAADYAIRGKKSVVGRAAGLGEGDDADEQGGGAGGQIDKGMFNVTNAIINIQNAAINQGEGGGLPEDFMAKMMADFSAEKDDDKVVKPDEVATDGGKPETEKKEESALWKGIKNILGIKSGDAIKKEKESEIQETASAMSQWKEYENRQISGRAEGARGNINAQVEQGILTEEEGAEEIAKIDKREKKELASAEYVEYRRNNQQQGKGVMGFDEWEKDKEDKKAQAKLEEQGTPGAAAGVDLKAMIAALMAMGGGKEGGPLKGIVDLLQKMQTGKDKAVADGAKEGEKEGEKETEKKKNILTEEKLKKRAEDHKGDAQRKKDLEGKLAEARSGGTQEEVAEAQGELAQHQSMMDKKYGQMDADKGVFFTAEEKKKHEDAGGKLKLGEGPRTAEQKGQDQAQEDQAMRDQMQRAAMQQMNPQQQMTQAAAEMKERQDSAQDVFVTNWPSSIADELHAEGAVTGGISVGGKIIDTVTGGGMANPMARGGGFMGGGRRGGGLTLGGFSSIQHGLGGFATPSKPGRPLGPNEKMEEVILPGKPRVGLPDGTKGPQELVRGGPGHAKVGLPMARQKGMIEPQGKDSPGLLSSIIVAIAAMGAAMRGGAQGGGEQKDINRQLNAKLDKDRSNAEQGASPQRTKANQNQDGASRKTTQADEEQTEAEHLKEMVGILKEMAASKKEDKAEEKERKEEEEAKSMEVTGTVNTNVTFGALNGKLEILNKDEAIAEMKGQMETLWAEASKNGWNVGNKKLPTPE